MSLPSERIKLSVKQQNIYQWGWQPSARHRVAPCGRRFGKTYLAAREIKRAAQLAVKRRISPINEIWYGAPTFKQAKRVFWRPLKRVIPRHWMASKPNESECSITLKSGHVIRIVGLDNDDNLRGSGLYFIVVDEWADCKPDCWTLVLSPMLATCEGHSLKIGTPKGFDHFHEDYQKGQPGAIYADGTPVDDHKSWTYTTLEGGNVSQKEIDTKRRELDPREFRQEYLATFETYTGQVLYAFSRRNNVKPCQYDPAKPVHVGMDFNVNPMTATVWQEEVLPGTQAPTWNNPKPPPGETISYQVGEVVIPTSDTDEMAKEITARYGRPGASPGDPMDVRHITIYPDPAGAQTRTSAQGKTDISILRGYGFKVLAMSSHPLVRDRIATTNSRFTNASGLHRAFVDPSCKVSITAYERLAYKDGTNDPDKKSGYDHPVDASGYYLFVRFGGEKLKQIKIVGF